MNCRPQTKTARIISEMHGSVPVSIIDEPRKFWGDKITLLGNNISLVKKTAQIANEIFGGIKNISEEELKIRTEYFKAICQEYLNGGQEIHVSIRPDLEKGIINLDYEKYFGEMTPFDMMCRGLYLDIKNRTDDGILLLPMSKFFNYGEPNAPTEDFILPLTEKIEFFEKIDGTMILARKTPNNELHIATRKTYFSSEAKITNEESSYLRGAKNYLDKIGTHWMDTNRTYTFELVFPEDEMARAVKHDNGLWVLSARDHRTGKNLNSADLMNEKKFRVLNRNIVHFPKQALFKGIEEASEYVKDLEGAEGFVGNFRLKNNLGIVRLKFKTPWWFVAHRAANRKKISAENTKQLIILFSSNGKNYVQKSKLRGLDAWNENKINEVTIKSFIDYVKNNDQMMNDNLDDLSAILKGQWKEALFYAKQHVESNESYSKAKKSLFVDKTVPKNILPYAGTLIDVYYGKAELSILDMLKYWHKTIKSSENNK